MTERSAETVKDCRYPWTWMLVASYGRVLPCCFARHPLGNLNEGSAESIWNGKTAQQLRSYIKSDRIHPICAGAICKYVQNSTAALAQPGAAQDPMSPHVSSAEPA
jgi:MoaA/NifB/PqqE/SkfB family radical SAM enzyme